MRIIAGALLVGILFCGTAYADGIELLTNGSFETGNFTGWTAVTTGSPFRPWAVSGAGQGGGFGLDTTSPQDGSFVAWNGFDGDGPMIYALYQDVLIPGGGAASLALDFRVQWNFTLGGNATLPRTFNVELRDPGTNGTLITLYSLSTGTQATNPTGNTGWVSLLADLSAFAGQNVRLYFWENIPQSFTGPGQFEIDGVSLTSAVPEPSALALMAAGLAGAFVLRRRRGVGGKPTNL